MPFAAEMQRHSIAARSVCNPLLPAAGDGPLALGFRLIQGGPPISKLNARRQLQSPLFRHFQFCLIFTNAARQVCPSTPFSAENPC